MSMNLAPPFTQASRLKASAGFTLIEVLVAALVLGIGLLGLAGIQSLGLRSNQSAIQRSAATMLADEIIDRVRANAQAAGSYDNRIGTDGNNCLAQACSPADLADYDLSQWAKAIYQPQYPEKARLPSGSGIVCQDSSPDDGTPGDSACDGAGTAYAVKIWWDDNRTGDPDKFQRFTTSFMP